MERCAHLAVLPCQVPNLGSIWEGNPKAVFPSYCWFPFAEHTQHIQDTIPGASLRDTAYLHICNDHVWEVWLCSP